MNNKIILIIYYLCMIFPINVLATTSENIIKQAQVLLEDNDYNGAYELLTPIADNYSDNAEFNYLYGSVLFKLQKYTLAVFVLERASLIKPDHIQTLETLAQSYTELKEFTKAEQLLENIKEKAPPEPAANSMQKLKNLFLQKNNLYKFSGFLGSTSGYDSNLTNGPTDSYLVVPVARSYGPMYVGNSLEKSGDFFTTINGGANVDLTLNEHYGINMGMYGSHRLNNHRPDQDLAFLSGWLGGSYKQDKNRIDLNFRRQSIWLSEADYQDQYSVLGQWSRALQTSTTLSLYAQASTLRYPNATNLDADSYLLGTILYHQFNLLWTPLLSAEIYGGELRVKGDGDTYEGYDSLGGRLTNQLFFNEKNQLLIQGPVEDRRYKSQNIYFITTRSDKGYSLTGKFSHSLLNKQLALSLQATWLLNESNLELYDYKRNLASFNVQWNF
ncbi:MAG: tetratricopeptide repeat protein [Candidatus Brocadiales bacterium]|nr:tetratricopeptide repeat protein [Candidatus Brocadiales bacterium]